MDIDNVYSDRNWLAICLNRGMTSPRKDAAMNGKRSREALLEFLDYLARKGLMNQTTARSRKAAANKVLAILDKEEAEDVTKLDLDHLFVRFSNISGSDYTPDSLNTYKSRLKSAIDDFKNYQDNPMSFRPSVQPSGRKVADRPKQVGSEGPRAQVEAPPRATTSFTSAPPTSVSILPIPIRPDLTIQVQGLPYDLTPAEANKIANVIRAMASVE
ncbi:hypothetical protein [Mesorhizobium sp. WSM4906]|uniref:hypothetical protein n=1 Tax=Mesorhizobium sp. WSM4906 TaxID=3038546 RepID=UPI002416E34B|nr:hypothetical protein [Mesorhizobium sp. WSM4906]WFP78742.1 hypothetical protein QAZ22_13440 [Mesorhizobium sp. WSM4906]